MSNATDSTHTQDRDAQSRCALSNGSAISALMSNNEKYKCKKCGHVCTIDEMESDAYTDLDPEAWSSWICPQCNTWHEGLEKGWDPVPNKAINPNCPK